MAHQSWYQSSCPTYLKGLFDLYGSDKDSNGGEGRPYPWEPHSYASVYETLFSHWRGSVKAVFECGLGTNDVAVAANMGPKGKPGASLRAWRDYFPSAKILGGDIDPSTLFSEHRIETHLLDQTDPSSVRSFWAAVGHESVDLIIDDGLHTFDAARCLFEGSWRQVSMGGFYVIEDVRPTEFPAFVEYFSDTGLWVTYVLMRRRPHEPVGDNRMVVVRRT